MKKLTCALALGATIALVASSASAQGIGTTINSTPLNVALTVTTNAPETSNGDNYSQKTKATKITNKDLITLFSHWSTNAFATSGAKLVIGWDSPWNGDVLVVSKDGTNVLFDASSGSANFYVDFYDEYGASSYKGKDASPGSYSASASNGGYFALYDNGVYLPYTSLWSYGAAEVSYTQSWDKNGDYSKWNASTSFTSPGEGDQYLFNSYYQSTTTAKIKSSGSGKGLNGYFY